MISKLLLTLLVIAGAIAAIRLRSRTGGVSQPSLHTSQAQVRTSGGLGTIKLAAYGVVVVMILALGGYLYYQWQNAYRVVTVHVIDSHSGKEVTYEAYQGDVESRRFTTVTGRQVNLAEVERMELSQGSEGR